MEHSLLRREGRHRPERVGRSTAHPPHDHFGRADVMAQQRH